MHWLILLIAFFLAICAIAYDNPGMGILAIVCVVFWGFFVIANED